MYRKDYIYGGQDLLIDPKIMEESEMCEKWYSCGKGGVGLSINQPAGRK